MQPIRSLGPDVAKAISGVCFDVDDTVTCRGTLDAAAYSALFDLKRAGLRLIAVTGRPLGFAEVIARMWPVDAAVGENGAGFCARTASGLVHGYWDTTEVRAMQQQRLASIRARVASELPEVQVSSDNWARRCDLAFDVGEEVQLPRATVDRLVALLESEGARSTVSSVHAHAQYGDHDKAQGVARLANELWGMPQELVRRQFFFIGDSGNDAAAFAWFEHCAGVGNVRSSLDRLKVPPRFVADAHYGEGFAEIARSLLAARSAV